MLFKYSSSKQKISMVDFYNYNQVIVYDDNFAGMHRILYMPRPEISRSLVIFFLFIMRIPNVYLMHVMLMLHSGAHNYTVVHTSAQLCTADA